MTVILEKRCANEFLRGRARAPNLFPWPVSSSEYPCSLDLTLQGQFTKHTTVKWPISLHVSGRFLVESGRFHIFDDVIVNYRSSVHSPDEVQMVPFLDVLVVQLVRQ